MLKSSNRYVGKTKTGRDSNAQAVHHRSLQNGKIARFQQCADTLARHSALKAQKKEPGELV